MRLMNGARIAERKLAIRDAFELWEDHIPPERMCALDTQRAWRIRLPDAL